MVKNRRLVETLKPKSDTRFFQKTVEDQNAKAAQRAKIDALFTSEILKISFQREPYAIIYPENIAIHARI